MLALLTFHATKSLWYDQKSGVDLAIVLVCGWLDKSVQISIQDEAAEKSFKHLVSLQGVLRHHILGLRISIPQVFVNLCFSLYIKAVALGGTTLAPVKRFEVWFCHPDWKFPPEYTNATTYSDLTSAKSAPILQNITFSSHPHSWSRH